MHSKRIITGTVLIALTLLLIFGVTPVAFAPLSAAIFCYASWEYSRLVGLAKLEQRNAYLFSVIIVALSIPTAVQVFLGIVWWGAAFYAIIRYERLGEIQAQWMRIFSGPLVLASCWVSINQIRMSDKGGVLLLLLLMLIWAGDTAAYFIGIRYGKTKLAERVSPNKTWEGLYGGLVASLVVGIALISIFSLHWMQWLFCLLLAGVTFLFSVVGDLYESMLKREQGIKDSGQIFPGHGGLLDRIDSLTAAAPVFTMGAYFLGLIT